LVDANNVVCLEFIRHSPVTNACDHGGQVIALLDEVFRADRVKESLANGDIAEFDTPESGLRCHMKSMDKKVSVTIRLRAVN
jgi:hypothetical protein